MAGIEADPHGDLLLGRIQQRARQPDLEVVRLPVLPQRGKGVADVAVAEEIAGIEDDVAQPDGRLDAALDGEEGVVRAGDVQHIALAQAEQIAVLEIAVEQPFAGQLRAVVVDRDRLLEILDLLQGEVEIGGAELAARPQIDGGGDPGQVVDVAHHRFDLGFVEHRAGGDLRGDAVDDELGDDALVVLDLLDLGFVDGDLKGALGQILRRRDHAHQDIAVLVVEPGDVVFQLRQVAARQLAVEIGGDHLLQPGRRFHRIAAEGPPG